MRERYLKMYKKGTHCASTSLMNMCSYHGLALSEDMCFGLGQALGFSFYKNELMNTYSFSGRSRDIDRNFFDILYIDVINGYGHSNEQVWIELNEHINVRKSPVLVKLDISSLNYLKSYFKLQQEIEQSEHLAVIIGIEEDKVFISEYFQKDPIIISKKELLLSMNKKFEEKAINNIYYVINNIPVHIDIKSCIRMALIKNTNQMLYGFGSNLGIPGLNKFVHDISVMEGRMNREQFENTLKTAVLSFEKIGTGGGNFRRMFARFLGESATLLQDDKLWEIRDIYLDLTTEWKQMCKCMENYMSNDRQREENLQLIYSILEDILKNEKKGILKLNKYSEL